ncbi:glutathione S-transferase II [Setomelanomma holmii]|uniref:Glutathione S-transferase II n=1 Tax=Setomelanomma holmii TaxID=210430 RepID=A0A9P4HB00_9PLEO|nr:glutathione S-transferase II [Setomelanomma holmii]
MAQPIGLIATKGIELLTFSTPNGFRIAILLEELKAAYNTPYTVQSIDIFAGVQKEPWYLALNPNGRIPVLIDHDQGDHVVTEGPAIMSYLTRMYDAEIRFGFVEPLEVSGMEQWMSWLHAGLGPNQTQANFFYRFCPARHAFPTFRFVSETERHYSVLDAHLQDREYVAGSGRGRYSIVDIALFPFVEAIGVAGIELERYPNVLKWWERVSQREAVKKGMMVPSGKPFHFGYEVLRKMKSEDIEGWEEREGPLEKALVAARREYGQA